MMEWALIAVMYCIIKNKEEILSRDFEGAVYEKWALADTEYAGIQTLDCLASRSNYEQ